VYQPYLALFGELIRTPFEHLSLVWGIVPLYFGLLLSELTSSKANFRTALQTGFSFLWAGAQWLYPWFASHGHGTSLSPHLSSGFDFQVPVNLFVTFVVIVFGLIALISGIRRRYFKYGSFVGYTRFSNYFMIAIYPMQAHALPWTWERVLTIALFAVPIWVVLHFGLMPFRKGK
jgi:hypothetical protein